MRAGHRIIFPRWRDIRPAVSPETGPPVGRCAADDACSARYAQDTAATRPILAPASVLTEGGAVQGLEAVEGAAVHGVLPGQLVVARTSTLACLWLPRDFWLLSPADWPSRRSCTADVQSRNTLICWDMGASLGAPGKQLGCARLFNVRFHLTLSIDQRARLHGTAADRFETSRPCTGRRVPCLGAGRFAGLVFQAHPSHSGVVCADARNLHTAPCKASGAATANLHGSSATEHPIA